MQPKQDTEYLRNPYLDSSDAFWLTGNLHTHTTRSDGRMSPQDAIRAYAAIGHDFLALSDHNTHSDYSGLDPCGLILLPANEISGFLGHVLAIGDFSSTTLDLDQQPMLDAVRRAGCVAVLCHPDWGESFNHYTFEQMDELRDYTGIEIYNGSIEEDPGSPLSTGKWDRLLAGRVVWGFATDDTHSPAVVGRGACTVRVKQRTPSAIIEALRTGSFYASTGQTIDRIEVSGTVLRITSPGAQRISIFGEYGRRLAYRESEAIEFDASSCASPYIRAECMGPSGRTAWTQPMFRDGPDIRRLRSLLTERPVFKVPRLDRGPAPNGDLSDPAWKDAAVTSRFLRSSDGSPAEIRTELRAVVAEGVIFFGIRAAEPDMKHLRLNTREHGNGNTWTDDCIEIFVDAENRARRYHHFMINADGFVCINEIGRKDGTSRKVGFRSAAFRDSTGYTVQLAVPLADLGLEPTDAGPWGFNAVRHRTPHPAGHYSWSFTGSTNHAPGYFGLLSIAPHPG